MSTPLLQIENLHTHFSTEEGVIKAVNGLNITLKTSEILSIVGESGCGKSVTAKSIMRLIPYPPGRIVDGKIIFEGKDLLTISDNEMRNIRGNKISMIFQEPLSSLNPVFRIGDQLAEVYKLHLGIKNKKALYNAAEMIEKVGIAEPTKQLERYPHQLSGGMRQRVMIAMALACNPRIIIADEPTTALDVTIQAQILDLMNDLKKDFETSIMLITHDLGVVAEMAQRVVVMYAGRVVEHADVEALFRQPMHPYTKGLMASVPNMDLPIPDNKMLDIIPGIVPNLLELPAGCAFEDRCDQSFDKCRQQTPPLFDLADGRQSRCWLHS